MMKVAVTGNVASGKSTFSQIWARGGIPLVQADELAREVVEPGTEGLAAVVEAFGREILSEDGRLNRRALGELVFGDPESRTRLEGILHPLILARRNRWMAEREGEGVGGLEGSFDVVVFVDAPHEERLRRLRGDRGLEEDEAKRMMDAQISPEEKRARADYVVHNAGSLEDLEIRALALLDLLLARSAGRKTP